MKGCVCQGWSGKARLYFEGVSALALLHGLLVENVVRSGAALS